MTRHLGVSVRRRAATTESRSTGCPVEQQCTPVTRRPANPHRGGSRPPLDSWSTTLSGRFHDRLRRPQGRLRPSRPPEERPTSRLCSTDESVVSHPPLPAEQHSFLPWALFPFKAPSHSAPIRPCQADGKPLLPNRSSTSAEPARAVCLRRTASSRRAIEIPSRVPPLYRAEARCWGAAGGPKPSPTAAPFQRDRGTPVGASCCPPSTEAEDERWDSAREVCPESEVVTPLVCNASDTLGVTRGRRPL